MRKALMMLGLVVTASVFTCLGFCQFTLIFVDPPIITTSSYEEFTVSIKVADVVDLMAWEISMSFNLAAVECVSIEEGPFLKQYWDTHFEFVIDNTAGKIVAFSTLTWPAWTGMNGSGTLAKVTFRCLGPADTHLHFYDSTLLKYSDQTSIPHGTIDGYVRYVILGDLNDDGMVNISDLVVFAEAFGSHQTHSRWNPNADLDNNGIVNIIDGVKIAKNFGKTS